MKRNLALMAATTLLAGFLTGCGGDSGGASANGTDNYCDAMKTAEKNFSDFDEGDMAGLQDAINTFHELAAEAPAEVKDAWKTLDGAMVGLEDALAEAGLKISDLEGLSNGDIPDDVDVTKLTALMDDLEKLGATDVEQASKDIEKHAKSECGVDLSGS